MDWSPQQEVALREVKSWLRDPGGRQVFRLFGYAGTGKTTLARELSSDARGAVYFAAYTGKAASVLRKNGLPAQTLHSLIYRPKMKAEEHLRDLIAELNRVKAEGGDPDLVQRLEGEVKAERDALKRPAFSLNTESVLGEAGLLVLDECSMVDEEMARDVLSFGVPVLVLGDPGQLPPIRGTGYFTEAEPDVMLTEIHRQARDNPIINLATLIRKGEHVPYGTYGDSLVARRLEPEEVTSADQILVWRNKTRVACNARVRALSGIHDPAAGVANFYPVQGERLVCLRNDREKGVLNGTIHYTEQDAGDDGLSKFLDLHLRADDDGTERSVSVHKAYFTGDEDDLSYWEDLSALAFTYGYALTVHKAQGSQWEEVVLFDECFAPDIRRRWLYTGVTRAVERLKIVRADR